MVSIDMFDELSDAQRNRHMEMCRYFFRSNVMKKHLDELVSRFGGIEEAVTAEWDEFWAYYSFWLAGLWVACEGIERISFGSDKFVAYVKAGKSLLHPIRQATFHFKPTTSDMMKHFETHDAATMKPWDLHQRIMDQIQDFLESLPPEYEQGLGS